MHRRLIRFVAAAALTLTVAGTVVAQEVVKNPCQDFQSGGGQLFFDPATNRYDFNFSAQTGGRCGGTVYTIYVFDTEADCLAFRGGSTTVAPLAVLTERGTSRTGQVAFIEPGLSSDNLVYVFGTSSQGRTIYDDAPDLVDGCQEVNDLSQSGGKWH